MSRLIHVYLGTGTYNSALRRIKSIRIRVVKGTGTTSGDR